MTLYFDSSYLFRLYSTESGADEVRCLAARADVVVSAWHARAEIASTFLRKRRERAAPEAALEEARAQFAEELESGNIRMLPLDDSVMRRVESVMGAVPADTYLRAADALHLACAAGHGFREVYSNDRHFLAAAPSFGLVGVNVIHGAGGG